MKKLIAKIRKIKRTNWGGLTLGEKIAKIVMKLIKWAIIIAIVVTLIGLFAAVAMAILVVFGITSAIAGGFEMGANAYVPGEHYVRYRGR